MAVATSTHSARSSALEDLRVNVIVGRAKSGLSQSELAERAHVSRQTISRIERASTDVGIEVVERIAAALGTSIIELLAPTLTDRPDDDELARRAKDPRSEYVDARALLNAVDEAAGRHTEDGIERFSRAGRPPVSRRAAPARR